MNSCLAGLTGINGFRGNGGVEQCCEFAPQCFAYLPLMRIVARAIGYQQVARVGRNRMLTKTLAHQPFYPIARNGFFQLVFCDRNREPPANRYRHCRLFEQLQLKAQTL